MIKNIEQFKQFVSKQVTVYGKDWLHEVSLRNFWRHRKIRFTSIVDYAESKTPPLKTKAGFLIIGMTTQSPAGDYASYGASQPFPARGEGIILRFPNLLHPLGISLLGDLKRHLAIDHDLQQPRIRKRAEIDMCRHGNHEQDKRKIVYQVRYERERSHALYEPDSEP